LILVPSLAGQEGSPQPDKYMSRPGSCQIDRVAREVGLPEAGPGCDRPARQRIRAGGRAPLYCSDEHSKLAIDLKHRVRSKRERDDARVPCPQPGCDLTMTAGSAGCIHHGRAGGADKALATSRQRIEQRLTARFLERGEAVPPAKTMAILVGREMTAAAGSKAADPIRRSKISRKVRERQKIERADGTIAAWHAGIELRQALAYLMKFLRSRGKHDEPEAQDYLARLATSLSGPKEGSELKDILAWLDSPAGVKAIELGAARGKGKSILAEFRRDRELRGRVFNEALSRHGQGANRGSRRRLSIESYAAVAWRDCPSAKVLPRVRDLIRPPTKRSGKQGIPDEFKTPWGFVVLVAVVDGLVRSKLEGVHIARHFGWSVHNDHGRKSRWVTAFKFVAGHLRGKSRFRERWADAEHEAAAHILTLARAIAAG